MNKFSKCIGVFAVSAASVTSVFGQFSNGGSADDYTMGKVGIGIAEPKYGSLHISGDGVNEGLAIGGTGTSFRMYVDKKIGYLTRGGSNSKGLSLSEAGKVGIGRNPSIYHLDVNGTTRTSILIATTKVQARSVENHGRNFHIGQAVDQGFTYKSKAIGNYSLGWYDLTDDGNNSNGDESMGPTGVLSGWNGLKFFTAKSERLYISREGNIVTGNGTSLTVNHNVTTPWSYAMTINVKNNQTKAFNIHQNGVMKFAIAGNGNVLAKKIYAEHIEVRSDAGTRWYDHVFNEDYDLMPLTEVEEFIQENKHLPTIPSQEDVNREGVNLVEMDGLLLKKVEELTLYVIELQKQIEILKANQE